MVRRTARAKASKPKPKAKSNGLVTIKLSVGDRFALIGILPTESGIATIRICEAMSKKLTPDEKEQETIGLSPLPNGGLTWNNEKARDRNISFSGFEVKLIVERLEKMDKDEKLTKSHVGIWGKFVGEKVGA